VVTVVVTNCGYRGNHALWLLWCCFLLRVLDGLLIALLIVVALTSEEEEKNCCVRRTLNCFVTCCGTNIGRGGEELLR
jgi:hypothetical protein